MSLFKDLSKENLLLIALHGTRAVIERELDVQLTALSLSEMTKQEFVRKAQKAGKEIKYPLCWASVPTLAATRDQQNNFAMRKHGTRLIQHGERATSKKGYIFPVDLGMEFHYVDSNPKKLLWMAQTLTILSATGGLAFTISVGDLLEFSVRLEIPLDSTINVVTDNDPQNPGASDITTNIVLHTQIGFFRDVSAVNGLPPVMNVAMDNGEVDSMELEIPSEL